MRFAVLLLVLASCSTLKPIHFGGTAKYPPVRGIVYACIVTPDEQEFRCITQRDLEYAEGQGK